MCVRVNHLHKQVVFTKQLNSCKWLIAMMFREYNLYKYFVPESVLAEIYLKCKELRESREKETAGRRRMVEG